LAFASGEVSFRCLFSLGIAHCTSGIEFYFWNR
jgi:hypothetical protein